MSGAPTYVVEVSGLEERVASTRPSAKHQVLLSALRTFRSQVVDLGAARLTAVRGDRWLARRKVVDAQGQLVHEDHAAWLAAECALDGGNVAATWRRLMPLGYQLAECSLTALYITVDRGGAAAENFLQLQIDLEDETINRRLFYPERSWGPRDLRELVSLSEDGPRCSDDPPRQHRPPAYRLRKVIDVAKFVAEAEAVYAAKNHEAGQRRYTMTSDNGQVRHGTLAELLPEARPHPVWKGRRLFQDWALSSAGRSGARLSEHWALDLSDWTDPRSGRRDMGLIPIWGFAGKLAEVDRPTLSDYALYAKLETLDRRVKVPFGWYFYMLHGNRVHDWAGERVIRAAEAGTIVLPEHDYRVLKAWQANPYGF